MQHGDIWRGIDLLAKHHGLSTSGLAKLAGLDATAFNKSKRRPKNGRPRWPSTESISRILSAVGTDFEAFARLVSGRKATEIPLLTRSEVEMMTAPPLAQGSMIQDMQTFAPPRLSEFEQSFAVEIGEDDLAPTYAAGDRLIATLQTELAVGDRVIIKPQLHRALFGTLCAVSRDHVEIDTSSGQHMFDRAALEWTARILWISQHAHQASA